VIYGKQTAEIKKVFRVYRRTTLRMMVLSLVGGCFFSMASGVTVTFSETAPSDNVYVAFYPETPAGVVWRNETDGSQRDLGQSFFASSTAVLESFSFQLRGALQVGARNANITVTIYESPTVDSIGEMISSQSGQYVGSGSGATSGGWVTFDVEDVSLTGGRFYTCMLAFADTASVRNQVFAQQSGDSTYTDGRRWMIENGVFKDSLSSDLAFSVQEKGTGKGILVSVLTNTETDEERRYRTYSEKISQIPLIDTAGFSVGSGILSVMEKEPGNASD